MDKYNQAIARVKARDSLVEVVKGPTTEALVIIKAASLTQNMVIIKAAPAQAQTTVWPPPVKAQAVVKTVSTMRRRCL